jgi:predicted transcriptional regulator
MFNKIKKHLELANKGYFKHMMFAMKIGLKCLLSFVTAFVHAINPAWFEYTTSRRIKRMNDKFEKNRINQQMKE